MGPAPADTDAGDTSACTKACPSAPCHEGVVLLGVMTSEGRLAYLQTPPRVDAAFVERAQALGHPERRFRFTTTCVEGRCSQWTGSACAVIDDVVATEPPADDEDGRHLPACSIRRTCRWYFQRGAAACAVCPTVVADTGGTLTWRDIAGNGSREPSPR